jgi:hypothetical protein
MLGRSRHDIAPIAPDINLWQEACAIANGKARMTKAVVMPLPGRAMPCFGQLAKNLSQCLLTGRAINVNHDDA